MPIMYMFLDYKIKANGDLFMIIIKRTLARGKPITRPVDCK